MLTCKEFLKRSYVTIQDPDADLELRWSLVLLRATMLAVPFWRRERVWRRMLSFLNYLDEKEGEGDLYALDNH